MSNCSVCGTRTGQHGFSWDKDKWPQPPNQFGILRVPIIMKTEEFLKSIDRIYGSKAPKVEFVEVEEEKLYGSKAPKVEL